MKTVKDLKKGETILTNVRKVAGGKFQIEIAEFVENPNAQVNVAALLNKGDDRFTQNSSKPRLAWQSATAEGLKSIGVDVTKLTFSTVEGKEIAPCNLMNPSIEGVRLHVRLVDSFEKGYEGQQPKQVQDKEGNITFFMKEGKHIYQTTQIVAGEAKHAIIASDERVSKSAVVTASKTAALNA